ncbi:hypothetical protein PVBG_03685 [Plasmodium vivax Brazil I]|uniref:Uncharacterized protein n=1 Tax=Plasmodium vivax (strain Brazil I) TaxID=1033975 RepID=A0A0J9T1U4_PLAV1|nr:hypothetical protein PVBG_03685 [Plasmodium vivax Brazil I]
MQDHGNDKYYSIGHCKLLNYWLYDQVKKILGSDPKDKYKKIVKDLHSAWNEYNNRTILLKAKAKQCNPESIIPSREEIEDKKLFHEHCINYYNISNKQNNNVCQMYKAFINNESLSYKNFNRLFSKDIKKYPTYYRKCKSYNPIKIIAASQCPKEFEVDPDSEDNAVDEELELASGEKQGVPTHGDGPSPLGEGVGAAGEQELPEPTEPSEDEAPSVENERGAKVARQDDAGLEGAKIPGLKREAPGPALARDLQTEKGPRETELTETEKLPPRGIGDLNSQDAMITDSDGNSIEANMQPKAGTIGATLAGSSLFLIMMYKVKKNF